MENKNIIEVHVDEIMREIRRKIQMEEDAERLPTFDSISFRNRELPLSDTPGHIDWSVLLNSLDYINSNYEVSYDNYLGPRSIKTFFKRVIRKLIRSIVVPIVYNQNLLNAHFVRCLNQVRSLAEDSKVQEQMREKSASLIQKLLEQQELDRRDKEELAVGLQDQLQKLEKWIQTLQEQQHLNCSEQEKTREQLHWLEREGILPENPGDHQLRQFVSQSGEDMILSYILGKCGIDEALCTYLDLGANHAKELSNTYHFYQRGARGVLVEANPTLIRELKFYRSGDQIINCCISERSGESIAFYVMSNDGLSTPDRTQVAEAMARDPSLKVERTVMVKTMTVNEIMDTYFDGAPVYLNVDIEGEEINILESIDFEAHRPMIISVEMIPYRTHLVVGEKNSEILEFMARHDYIEYAFTGINSIFLDKRQIDVTGWDLESVQNLLLTRGKPLNCIPYAKTNEFAQNKDGSVTLFPCGISFGPYLSLPGGDYQLDIVVNLNGDQQNLTITSESGTRILGEFPLTDGDNKVSFHLQQPQEAVEFVLRNETQETFILSRLILSVGESE